MRYVRLGASDLTVSVLALGCGNFGGIGSRPELVGRGEDEPAAVALLDRARDLGITLLDTANSYGGGRSEEWIGRWLASRQARDQMVLTTKVRNPVGPGPDDAGLSARHIRTQIDASLRRLGTDHIDLYLAHEPDPAVPLEETIAAFDALIQAGKIRQYGLSNYPARQVEEAVRTADRLGCARPVNLQSSYNLLDRTAASCFPACSRYGIGFTAYSPLAGGWLAGKYRAGQPYPAGSRMALLPGPYASLVTGSTFQAIEDWQRVAAGLGVPLPTYALAWVLGDPAVCSVILGSRTPDQLTDAVAALDLDLSPAAREL